MNGVLTARKSLKNSSGNSGFLEPERKRSYIRSISFNGDAEFIGMQNFIKFNQNFRQILFKVGSWRLHIDNQIFFNYLVFNFLFDFVRGLFCGLDAKNCNE